VLDSDPLRDIAVLQAHKNIQRVWMDGMQVQLPPLPIAIPRHPRELAQGMWSHLYTQDYVAKQKRQSLSQYDGPPLPIDDPYPEALK
jgi:hypothetical protein